MSGLTGFAGRHYHRSHSYDDPYSTGSEGYSQDSQDQRRRLFAFVQREAYVRALQGERSRLGNMTGFQSSYAGGGGRNPLMGGPHLRTPSPWGASTGSSCLGHGMDRPYIGMNTGLGMSDGFNSQPQSTFFRNAPMGSRSHMPFIMATSRQRYPEFTSRRRRNHSPWRYSRYSPLATRLFNEEDEDGFGYSSPSIPEHSRQRRREFTHVGRSPYRGPESRSWTHSLGDPYDYEDDEDEDYDESDFEDFYPLHHRRTIY